MVNSHANKHVENHYINMSCSKSNRIKFIKINFNYLKTVCVNLPKARINAVNETLLIIIASAHSAVPILCNIKPAVIVL